MPLSTASSPERLLRGAFALLAVVLLLVAVWVSMARALLPLLNEYRSELESALRTHLGRDVRIGQITGSWVGLSAQLVARDIEIRNGDQLIYLENLNIIPALWSSLRRGSLQLSRIAVEGLQLGVRQQADGQWQLKGLGENNAHSAPAPFDPARVLRLFSSLQEVLLIDARLTVEPWQRPAFTFNDIDAQLNTTAETLQLHSRWRLPDGQSAALRVDMDGSADAWPDVRAQVYAELPNADWVPWLPSLTLPQGGEITRLSTGGQLWLTWAAGRVQRVVTHVTAPAIDVRGVQQSAAFSDVQGTLWWSRTAEAGWQLQTSALDGQFAGRPLGIGALQVEYTRPDAPWMLHLSSLDLTPLSQMAMQLAPLPPLAHEIVATLAPQGVLESAQVQVHVQPEQALPEVRYRVQLKQVGTQAWGDVPAFANISGELSGTLHGGELRLDTQQFMLSLPRLFPEAWRYRTAQARLQWQWDERAFTLSSRLMRLSGDEGELAGNMLIRLFHDPAAESYMDLQVGLRQGSALYTPRYLPTRLAGFSPSLANWLQQAIRGGQVEQGMFIYQGALSAQRPETARALALYFNVNEVALDYQAEWPPLSQVRGEVFVEDDRVRVVAPSGRAWNSQLENVDVQLDRRRTPMKLQVTGSIRSDVVDGLRILQDTPLGREKTFSTWKGEGVLRGDLQLDIPLEGKEEVRARVGFATENARLQLTNPALDIQAIQGRFLYDTERGLSSNDIQAQLWGQSVRGRLQASGRPGKPRSQLTAEGLTEVARLAKWLGAPDPLPVSGRLPYRLALDVQGDERWLTVKSSLQGVAVDLPAPLGKLANEVRDSQWQMNFTGREQVYRFTQPGLMSVDMALPMGARLERARAELRFGSQAASAPSEPGWRLLGDLAQVDIGAWRAALDKWTSKSNGSGLGALRSINLNAKTATLGELTFSPLSVALDTQADWQLLLDSPELKGQLAMPNQTGAPWRLHVQRLQLPARNLTPLPPGTPPSPDPLASVNPRALPALDAQIDNLWQGTDRLGRWQFQARPTATGVAFTHLNLEMRGLHINGQLEWQGAAGATRTHYQGSVYGQDANDVLLAWGFAPSISSEHFRVSVDGGWPGSPAQAGLRQFSGSVDIRARNGQVAAVESGALRVFGIFNFDALRRRLRFDFSDLFGKGLAYDRIDGRLQGTDGVFLTDKPFTLEGPSTRLALEGQLDAVNEQMASRLKVSLPLSNNLPVAALLAGALPMAGALLIVDRLMGDQISKVASVEYRVDGPWQNPQISPFGKPGVSSDSSEASE